MEWLYGDFTACPQDLESPVNDGFTTVACPVDPASLPPWYEP